jgi:hypothetical protein
MDSISPKIHAEAKSAKMNNIKISWHDAARSAAAMLSVLVAVPQSFAQSDYEPLPPITVHPQPYYPPPPNPLDVLGAILTLPFNILGGIASAFPPQQLVPDGLGGWVPITNSRVMPDGSLRRFDPSIDLPPLQPTYLPSMQPEDAKRATASRPLPPRRRHAKHPEPKPSGGCYGPDGKYLGTNAPPGCRG